MRELRYTKSAIRSLRKMPANTATLIVSKIEAYAKEPETQNNNLKMLKGRQGFRLRVGSWRVIMDDDGNVLAVLDTGHRGDRKIKVRSLYFHCRGHTGIIHGLINSMLLA